MGLHKNITFAVQCKLHISVLIKE